jgi:hypothetical protein
MNPSKYGGNILLAKFIIPFASSPAFILDDSTGWIAREFWWTNQEFSPVDIIMPCFSMLIYHLGDGTVGSLEATAQRSCLTIICLSS